MGSILANQTMVIGKKNQKIQSNEIPMQFLQIKQA
jgi:hypothetical protein